MDHQLDVNEVKDLCERLHNRATRIENSGSLALLAQVKRLANELVLLLHGPLSDTRLAAHKRMGEIMGRMQTASKEELSVMADEMRSLMTPSVPTYLISA